MTSLINPKYAPTVYTALAGTAVGVGIMFSPLEEFKIIGLTICTGVIYGIFNDMIACRECIQYFTIGHIYREGDDRDYRPLRTLNPTINALVWGMERVLNIISPNFIWRPKS